MFALCTRRTAWSVFILCSLALGCVALLPGCGGKEEPEAPAAPVESAAKVAPEAPPAPPAPPKPDPNAPLTLPALRFMPAQTQVALGVPPLSMVLAKLEAFSRRYGPVGVDPMGEVNAEIARFAKRNGLPEDSSLEQIATAKGIDINAPIAVFFEVLDPTGERAPDDDPRWAGVLGVKDADAVRQTIREVVMKNSIIPTDPMETVKVGDMDVVVHHPDHFAYFLTDDFVVVGNSQAMVQAAAARAAQPAKLDYGTAAHPAEARDEMVALVYPGRLNAATAALKESPDLDPAIAGILNTEGNMLETMFADVSPDTALVTNLVWDREYLKLGSRIDLEKFPHMLATAGEPSVLRLTRALPETTVVFLGLGLPKELRTHLLPLITPISLAFQDDAKTAMALTQVNQVLELIGDEVTVGITTMEYDFPSIYIMARLAEPQQLKDLVQLLVKSKPAGEQDGVTIMEALAAKVVSVFYAFVDDAVLVSNDVDGLKALITRVKNDSASPLFTQLKPAIDPKQPLYSVFHVDSRVMSDVVVPAMDLAGEDMTEVDDTLTMVTAVVDQIRAINHLDGQWLVKELRVSLKPGR